MSNEFGQLNLEEMQQDAERVLRDNTKSFISNIVQIPDPKPGGKILYPVRILPPRKGARLYQYTRLHYVNKRNVQCPRPQINGKWDKSVYCPFCESYDKGWTRLRALKKEGFDDKSPEFKAVYEDTSRYKPIERYYYNVIVRKVVDDQGEHLNVGPLIWPCNKTCHKKVLLALLGDDTEKALGNVTDPKNGWDFVIKKIMRDTGTGLQPNYDESYFDRDQSPAGTPDEISKWAESLHDLTTLRVVPDNDKLEHEFAILMGYIPDDSEKESFDPERIRNKYAGHTSNGNGAPTTTTNVDTALDHAVSGSTEATASEADSIPVESAELMAEFDSMMAEEQK